MSTDIREKSIQRILDCPRLPSLPAIALRILELTRQPDVNMREIASTISQDPALTSKVLKTVNSSYFGLSQQVTTVQHGMVMLGLNAVKTLALGFSLMGNVRVGSSGHQFDMMKFWRKSLYTAVAARSIAQHNFLNSHEEAFLIGLLKNLGMIAMIEALGNEYVSLLSDEAQEEHLLAAERKAFGVDHEELSGIMTEKWQFPELLHTPIAFCSKADQAPEQYRQLTRVIKTASMASNLFNENHDNDQISEYYQVCRRWFKWSNKDVDASLKEIGEGAEEIARLFEITTTSVPDPEHILSQANEALAEIAFQTANVHRQLQKEHAELEKKATTDPLTGVANRGRFNEYLEQIFAHTNESKQPVSLIFVDADRFKTVNDTYGHSAGDCVLRAIASVLATNAPEQSLVSRYGGEEFAIVLPNMDLIPAARLAEELRKSVERLSIPAGEDLMLSITASMGVSTSYGDGIFSDFTQLIDAADRAVYAAKASGRNCVRIFTPKAAS